MSGSNSYVGLILGSYAIAQLLFRIPFGISYDRANKKKLWIIFGLISIFIGVIWMSLSKNFTHLFIGRTITGIGAATWGIFSIYLSSYFPKALKIQAISIATFINHSGIVVATLIGGFMAQQLGFQVVFVFAGFISMIAVLVFFTCKEVSVVPNNQDVNVNFFHILSDGSLIYACVMGLFLQFVTHATIFGFSPLYAKEIGASEGILGVLTMLSLAFSGISALILIKYSEKWSYGRWVYIGAIFMGISMFLLPLNSNLFIFGLLQIGIGIGRGFLMTIFMALSIRQIPQKQHATSIGIFQAIYALGMLSGPIVSGQLADSMGIISIFYLCGIICFCILLGSVIVKKINPIILS